MYEDILRRMLGAVSDERDKRQGSIIYDTLAPVAAELAQMQIVRDIFEEQTFLTTASGSNLDNRAADFAIIRYPASHAVRIAEMTDTDGVPLDLPVGNRFSTPNTAGGLNFTLIAPYDAPGRALLTCETSGTVGNAFLGALLPLFAINNLGTATMVGTYTPARDAETDAELRARVLERINQKAFGGNVAQYTEWAQAVSGVGDVKVFPVWDGGGTVMLSVIDGEYNPVTPDFIEVVQTIFDPIPNNGLGLGTAPIGHRVTVVTPAAAAVDIAATVALQPGYTIPQLQASIEVAIADYLLELRHHWADSDTLYVFTARVAAAIIGIEGVSNVTGLTINGNAADLSLPQSPVSQLVPVLGGVVLSNA